MSPPLDRKKMGGRTANVAPGREIFTISALNEAAKAALEASLGTVWVEGEISNIARPASGHVYFSLKDANAQIRCAMFRSRSLNLGFKPENGLSVLAKGRVSLYTARGDYQLLVDTLEPAGDGALRLRFEALKRRLYEEGLFDAGLKRELPAWPRQIGVITSPTGAALRDIITVLARRCPAIPIIVYPTAVQGQSAAGEISAAINRANRRAECDVLIVGRGGGSLEDLWPFNEEQVARAVFESELPIISAVGHEIDVTISDFVADLRAATPSAAAELVSPDTDELLVRAQRLERRLGAATTQLINHRNRELRQIRARLLSPERQLETHYQRVDELSLRLHQAMRTNLALKSGQHQALTTRIAARSPGSVLTLLRSRLEHLQLRATQSIRQTLKTRQQTLNGYEAILRAMGPMATLERGYAIVTNRDGELVTSSSTVNPGDELNTRLASGRVFSEVKRTESGDE